MRQPETSRRYAGGFTLIELLIVLVIIGILAAIAIPNLLQSLQRARQKRTMASIRSVATAWEARGTDYGRYNAAGYAVLSTPITLPQLESLVMPTYIRDVPNQDGWQRRWIVSMDQAPFGAIGAKSYQITSYGRNGLANPESEGATTNFDCDIVFETGSFIAYPEGVQLN